MQDQQNEQFISLMERIRAGSEAAARELQQLYGPHIQRIVRQRLNRRLRTRYDSEDFVQAVWKSFYADLSVVGQFDEPEQLARFLARVASNKVIDECRRCLATQKSNVNRERPIHDGDNQLGPSLRSREPTGSEVAVANEQWSRMTEGQPDHYIEMLQLRRDGATLNEIAEVIGVNERTVRRVLTRLQSRAR